MAIKLFYITNSPEIALIAQDAGVDRIFIDLEQIGKAARQGGMDTVQSCHCIDDIKVLKKVITKAEILVRCNPIHEQSEAYSSTEDEIDDIIAAGADIIMLPYFKSVQEVERFLSAVNGRCHTMLLFETPESVEFIDDILELSGIDEGYIGLNDLSLGYGYKFMFELLSNSIVENLCAKFKKHKIPYGFGGIAAIGTGMLPAESILKEHYRLGSTMVILARAFCNTAQIQDVNLIKDKFAVGVNTFRSFEQEVAVHSEYFERNRRYVNSCVDKILENR